MRAFSSSCLILAARARSFSSPEFLAMPSLSRSCCTSLVTMPSRSTSECSALFIATLLPPAKISCRPCSSYHLVSVAVMCIFSMMLRQPTPVL
jgi:hypothetical protein